MKKAFLFSVFIVLIQGSVYAQTTLFPAIKHYGGIYDVPGATDMPDTTQAYNFIIEAGSKIDDPKELYDPFEMVCRLYNLHAYAGVQPKNLRVDLVIYARQAAVILNNEAYKKKFGVDNPNLEVIEEMTKAGIHIYACGQSVTAFEIDPETINPNIQVVFSRMTTVSARQMKGYAYFKF